MIYISNNINRIGNKYETREGYIVEIVEKVVINGRAKYRIAFNDSYSHTCICDLKELKNGAIKNPYHPSVYNVGYFGVGEYAGKINGKNTDAYEVWRGIIRRCYDESHQSINPTYIGTTVSYEWLNFQNFAKFYYTNIPKIEGVRFALDKDILQQSVEYKIYSKETCIFIPMEINSFMTNKQDKHNTSGYTGVSENTNKKGFYRSQINDFETGKYICIKSNCETKEEAYKLYQEYRKCNAEKVKVYLRSLNYLSEYIIQLIN